ncbi:hypothetical protein [Deinococcus hopiensis]|uniref:hypothetical protein n=1 Tax=Deinococcus hopiensis TaxID=309885 RepID=UPI001FE54952|nr:hypothetical protein [Deinococcus hopiensis]
MGRPCPRVCHPLSPRWWPLHNRNDAPGNRDTGPGFGVEPGSLGAIPHLEVDVTDGGSQGRAKGNASRLCQHRLDLHGLRVHLHLPALPGPPAARAVPVDLDAVALGVMKANRRADEEISIAQRRAPGSAPGPRASAAGKPCGTGRADLGEGLQAGQIAGEQRDRTDVRVRRKDRGGHGPSWPFCFKTKHLMALHQKLDATALLERHTQVSISLPRFDAWRFPWFRLPSLPYSMPFPG